MSVYSEYFSINERTCKCCGRDAMSQGTLNRLDRLRERIGPLKLSSAYRCPLHNSQVSSTGENGPHTTGRAVDVLASGTRALEIVRIALELGFTGIGVSQKGPHGSRFVHLDDIAPGGAHPRPHIWSY